MEMLMDGWKVMAEEVYPPFSNLMMWVYADINKPIDGGGLLWTPRMMTVNITTQILLTAFGVTWYFLISKWDTVNLLEILFPLLNILGYIF